MRQIINRGQAPGDPEAENLYTGTGKINQNFEELYSKFNGLLTPLNITRVGNLFKVPADRQWLIAGNEYTNPTDFFFTVTVAPAGYRRYDLLVVRPSGFERIVGTASTGVAQLPDIPNAGNAILASTYYIDGSSVDNGNESGTGSDFLTKISRRDSFIGYTGSDVMLPPPYSYNGYRLIGSGLISVSGIDSFGFNAVVGDLFPITNLTGGDVMLNDSESFITGDLVLPDGKVATFKYEGSGVYRLASSSVFGGLDFIKSNEDLSLAKRNGNILYGILDQYTGEEITLLKVTGTPVVDGVIYFQLGSEYFKRVYKGFANIDWSGAKGDGITDDSLLINAFLNSLGEGASIEFKSGKTYLLKNAIIPQRLQTFSGYGATLKRTDESKTTLSTAATSVSNSITVDSIPSDWKVGDALQIIKGVSAQQTTGIQYISSIVGNTVTMTKVIGSYRDATTAFDTGSIVRKVFHMVAGSQYPLPCENKWYGVRFDGNRDNNASNYYWYFNSTIHNYGYKSVIQNCRFDNIPNENIVTHGSRIEGNTGNGLNGSFVHLSSPPANLGETYQGCVIHANTVFNTNAINPTITEHSYAVVEQSWNAGKCTISNNQFSSANKYGYCYDVTTQIGVDPTVHDEVVITGNIFRGYWKISNDIMVNQSWSMIRTIMTDNFFIDCGTINYADHHKKGKIFKNNIAGGGTVIQNLKNYDAVLSYDTKYNIDDTTGAIANLEATSGTKVYYQSGAGVGYAIYDSVTNKMYYGKDQLFSGSYPVNSVFGSLGGTMTEEQLNIAYTDAIVSVGFEVVLVNQAVTTIYKKISATKWARILTSDNIVHTSATTTALSLATLNNNYPLAFPGFKVHCMGITGGGLIYEKTANGWCSYATSIVL